MRFHIAESYGLPGKRTSGSGGDHAVVFAEHPEAVAEGVVLRILLRGDRLRLREGIRRGDRGEACRKQCQKQEQSSRYDLKSELNSFHGVTPLSVHIIYFVTVL